MEKFGFCLIVIQFLTHMCLSVADDLTKCEVGVALPWESSTYVPEESSVRINCTADASQNPVWTIQLPGRTATLQFTFQASIRTLNDNGFYQLSELDIGMNTKTIRLLINSTIGINGTVVRCDDIGTGNPIAQTKLIIYEPIPVNLLSVDIDIQKANISWNPSTLPVSPRTEDINQTYMLTVVSNNVITMQPQIFQLHQPHYVFTAPDGAPPCEVYNFSVTATYVGATYTGAGCSVPSPVLSRMLPSLPYITILNSSLTYLAKIDGEINLNASFESGLFCESYPILNYTLEVMSSSSDAVAYPVLPYQSNMISGLLPNREYSFRLLVANAIGTVISTSRQFYTTDIQLVTATYNESSGVIIVQCYFIPCSDAQGCVVVLVGEMSNTTVNLTRVSSRAIGILNLTQPCLTYGTIFGHNVESDGSIGASAVPGRIDFNATIIAGFCSINAVMVRHQRKITLIVYVIVALFAFGLVVAVGLIILVVIFYKLRIKHGGNTTDSEMTMNKVVYGVSTDGIETTANEVYGVSTDGIVTTPNEVYGVSTDGIVTTPNEVYGVSTDGIETTLNEVYGASTDNTVIQPNERLYRGCNRNRNNGPSPTHVYEDVHTLLFK